MSSLAGLVPVACSVLAALKDRFEREVAALARSCADGETLDAARLDRYQVGCYEAAFASAELLAAETALAAPPVPGSELDLRLALTFVVEAIGSIIERLHAIALDVESDCASLLALQASRELRELRRSILASGPLEETGRLLSDDPENIGYIAFNDELSMAQSQFRRVAAELIAPLAADIHRHDLTVPESVLRPLRSMGVFGLSIPERFGGIAPDDREDNLMMIVVTEALSEASLGAAGSLITRPEILARALLTGGTEVQKREWLPKIAAGDPLCAIAITEPDYGSDVAGLQLKAAKIDKGWLLDGAKLWCTFAGKAGLIMVVARTSPDRSLGHRGLSVLLVEKPSYEGHEFEYRQPTGGRLAGRAIPTIGYRGMHSFELSFESLFVPDANVIGGAEGLGNGFYFTMAGMMGGRMQTAARACGVMRAALLAAFRYAGDRKVFNAPLASYGLTRAKLARMAARFAACRRLAYAVGRLLDSGAGRMESSLIKLFACRSAEWITREAQQIHGGMGYAEETPISRYFVDARVLSIFEGAEETLALKVIARSLCEDALRREARSRIAP
jgi:(2S)-methylsuccinyl-CoA dehydrogenase